MSITLGHDEEWIIGNLALICKVIVELNISNLSVCGGLGEYVFLETILVKWTTGLGGYQELVKHSYLKKSSECACL